MVGKTERPEWLDALNPPEPKPAAGIRTHVVGVLKPADAKPAVLNEMREQPGVDTEVLENGEVVVKVNTLTLPEEKKPKKK